MAQKIKVTGYNHPTVEESVSCFNGLNFMNNIEVRNLYYKVSFPDYEGARRDVRLLRSRLLPALGLDKKRVVLHKSNDGWVYVTIRSIHGDRMWDVFILTSIFRNFYDCRSTALNCSRLIKSGMSPVAAMAVASRVAYHPRKKQWTNYTDGFHALFTGHPLANYAVLNDYIKGELPGDEDMKLTNTMRSLERPRPHPTFDESLSKKSRRINTSGKMGEIINSLNEGDYSGAEEIIKEGTQ